MFYDIRWIVTAHVFSDYVFSSVEKQEEKTALLIKRRRQIKREGSGMLSSDGLLGQLECFYIFLFPPSGVFIEASAFQTIGL